MAERPEEFKIRLPEDEARRLREWAAREDRTINSVVRRAIREYLATHDPLNENDTKVAA